jgi:hypothetical protein
MYTHTDSILVEVGLMSRLMAHKIGVEVREKLIDG